MIDICCVIYKNYNLLNLQINHWKNKIKGDFNLLFCDNTPEELYISNFKILRFNQLNTLSDGESHGQALDYLIRLTESDIIGIVDSDFFWLNPNILFEVEEYFNQGYKAVGCSGFYPDWQQVIDIRHPDHAGHLAPVCWGMFIDRQLALQHTFVCTHEEGAKTMYTGWRLRKYLIDNKIPTIVFPGWSIENDPEASYFGFNKENPDGVHLLKGSSGRASRMDLMFKYLNR